MRGGVLGVRRARSLCRARSRSYARSRSCARSRSRARARCRSAIASRLVLSSFSSSSWRRWEEKRTSRCERRLTPLSVLAFISRDRWISKGSVGTRDV